MPGGLLICSLFVCPSVGVSITFQFSRLFLGHPLRYWLEKISIWISPVVFQIKFNLVSVDRVLQELCPFEIIQFSRLFSDILWDIDLKLSIWIGPVVIQIKFNFGSGWLSFVGVMPLWNLLGPVGDMYCFSNTLRMLVQFKCGTRNKYMLSYMLLVLRYYVASYRNLTEQGRGEGLCPCCEGMPCFAEPLLL